MLADMLISSLTKFASQLKSSSGGQLNYESTQYVPSDHENDTSDHDNHLEMMTEEEERAFETSTLASQNARRGNTSWKASQKNTKFYSQAQQARHQSESLASQAHSLDSVDQGQGQAQPLLLDQAQAPAQVQPAGQDQFPVLLPQGQGQPLLVLARHGDLDSLYRDENFSLDLDNKAALREKQAHSEALDKAEFCKLDRQDSDAKREVMGMRLPVYNAPARKSIELSLPWHSSTIPIADRNHNNRQT